MRIILIIPIAMLSGCTQKSPVATPNHTEESILKPETLIPDKKPTKPVRYVKVMDDVPVKEYFPYMDALIAKLDTIPGMEISEQILVHANLWVLDSLKNTDYYIQKSKGKFLYNQADQIILHKSDSLYIPDSTTTAAIRNKLLSTVIDVNIPEFTLRLIQSGDTILSSMVRVGRNAERYLELAGRRVDMKTPIGKGEIVRITRVPYYVDPETGKRYDSTRRDDGKYSRMPIIPWLEPSINQMQYGTLIHPTTNPKTLGKAVSHGCIGTSEADAWTIYYHSIIGTKVIFRYDLKVAGEKGDSIQLRDIYGLNKR